jgi:hypothetical protein
MARGRFVNRKISVSDKLNDLPDDTCRLLATWIIPYLDKQGVFHARPAIVKNYVFALREDISFAQVEQYLQAMHDIKLIVLFDGPNGKRYQYWPGFEEEQPNLRPDRERTDMPKPTSEEECQRLWGAGNCQPTASQLPDNIPATDSQLTEYLKASESKLSEIRNEDKPTADPPVLDSADKQSQEGASAPLPPPSSPHTLTQDEIDHPDPVLVNAWKTAQPELQMSMQRATFDQYVVPLRPVCLKNGAALFVTEWEQAKEWCEAQLRDTITSILGGILERPIQISIAYQPGGT